ncbi:OLC1v1014366C1 [Oldenlandia corymbosa var. corymbosa]|uniref:peptidyl-tRNA hydrolase n=1 Tax=Oldenlandia corymbosa var. corymbosa TaxID=529605 RepID=A0AAV1E433_OLDCO|nr:OLC1v1014366C1 [Oldenlandia corymbosa var. corymbosa]
MASIIQTLISSRLFTSRHPSPSTFPLYNPPLPSNSKLCEDTLAVGNATDTADSVPEPADPLIQYVVLRRDLIDTWPLGSIVSQGCHASVAAISTFKDDPFTLDYCSPNNLNFMRKVTVEVKGEAQMLNLSEKLKSNGIDHKLWIEQPENFPTCIATKPYPKSIVSSFFKKLKLCK